MHETRGLVLDEARKEKSRFRQDTQEIALKREATPVDFRPPRNAPGALSPLPRWPGPFSGGELPPTLSCFQWGTICVTPPILVSSPQCHGWAPLRRALHLLVAHRCVVTSVLLLWEWEASLVSMSARRSTAMVYYTHVCTCTPTYPHMAFTEVPAVSPPTREEKAGPHSARPPTKPFFDHSSG